MSLLDGPHPKKKKRGDLGKKVTLFLNEKLQSHASKKGILCDSKYRQVINFRRKGKATCPL
jgi:hypothetical protein